MITKFLTILVPHFFTKEKISSISDPDLVQAIELVKKCASVETAMQEALTILSNKYTAKRLETFLFFYKWFEKNPNKLWKRKGFMHCTQQNYLFRVLLVESKWLRDEQIDLGYSLVWYISPHQYLKINLISRTIAIDPWNYLRGTPYGRYAAGFGSRVL